MEISRLVFWEHLRFPNGLKSPNVFTIKQVYLAFLSTVFSYLVFRCRTTVDNFSRWIVVAFFRSSRSTRWAFRFAGYSDLQSEESSHGSTIAGRTRIFSRCSDFCAFARQTSSLRTSDSRSDRSRHSPTNGKYAYAALDRRTEIFLRVYSLPFNLFDYFFISLFFLLLIIVDSCCSSKSSPK